MQPIHAINFAPFARRGALTGETARRELARMAAQTGADTVIFCPSAIQSGPFAQTIDFTGPAATADEELLDITEASRSLGLRVMWKPTVNCADGTWRAHINFFDHEVPCEPKWSVWFRQYTAFQTHFARLARQTKLDLLILGCEMTNTERREQDWRQLIAAVRSEYDGALSYNCDKYGEEYVTWWDALDVICSSGYYPVDAIAHNLDRIEQVVNALQKPFFFAEAGCMRVKGSAHVPNDWTLQGTPDDAEQTRWYRALFDACRTRPWFGGYGLWAWPLTPHPEDYYHFRDKPALTVIRQEFQK